MDKKENLFRNFSGRSFDVCKFDNSYSQKNKMKITNKINFSNISKCLQLNNK